MQTIIVKNCKNKSEPNMKTNQRAKFRESLYKFYLRGLLILYIFILDLFNYNFLSM